VLFLIVPVQLLHVSFVITYLLVRGCYVARYDPPPPQPPHQPLHLQVVAEEENDLEDWDRIFPVPDHVVPPPSNSRPTSAAAAAARGAKDDDSSGTPTTHSPTVSSSSSGGQKQRGRRGLGEQEDEEDDDDNEGDDEEVDTAKDKVLVHFHRTTRIESLQDNFFKI
jgi:hypothetical protein